MKKSLLILLLFPVITFGQSKVMRNLAEEYPDARALMFYYSSLNMLNIEDDPEFTEMISDIEKIKVLIVDKQENNVDKTEISDLKTNLKNDGFEELMTLKSKDYDVGVYINDDDGDIEGYFFVMEEESSLIAVDLIGNMPVGDISKLIDKIKEANDF